MPCQPRPEQQWYLFPSKNVPIGALFNPVLAVLPSSSKTHIAKEQ